MRYIYQGHFVDLSGNAVTGGTITIYLAGTTTLASVYIASSGGITVNSVTSDSTGKFVFYVDISDYNADQKFKIVLSKSGFLSETYDDITIYDIPEYVYYADSSAADQSLDANDNSIADLLATIGTSSIRTIVCKQGTYTFSTTKDWSAYTNVTLKIQPGTDFAVATGVTITLGCTIDAGLQQWISLTGTGIITFGSGSVTEVYPQWWGAKGDGITDNTIAMQYAANASAGNTLFILGGTYLCNINITVSKTKIKGAGMGKTILKSYTNAAIITIDSTAGPLQYCKVEDLTLSGDVTKASQDGILITGTNINDWHSFNNIFIEYSGRYGIYISGRSIWSDFKHINIIWSENYGIYIDSGGAVNLITFENVGTTTGKTHGWRITNNGDTIPYGLTFINCNSEFNSNGTATVHGMYFTSVRNFYMINTWLEDNGINASGKDSRGILIDGSYSSGSIKGGYIANHYCGVDIQGGAANTPLEIGGGVRIIHNATIPDVDVIAGIRVGAYAVKVSLDQMFNTYVPRIVDTIDASTNYHIQSYIYPSSDCLLKLSVNDTTPSVVDGNVFVTYNNAPTTITMFNDGTRGQTIKILFTDVQTTIDFTGTNLKGNAGVNWVPTTNDWMECIFDGTNWYCAVHDCTT